MRNLKKLLVLVVALVLATSLMLTGCGGSEKAAESTTPAPASGSAAEGSAVASATVPAEAYQLDWYFMGGSEPQDLALIESKIGEYLKDKINATVKMNILDWANYQQKMGAMLVAGQKFDICFTSSWFLDYPKNSQDGYFVELNQYTDNILKPTWDMLKSTMGEEFLNGSKINGKNYAIPTAKEGARHWGFVYNKTMAEKYKFDMSTIKKFEDIEPMLKTVKENEPSDVVPLFNDANLNLGFIPWNATMPDAVGQLKDGKWVNQYETPEYKAGYELIRDYYNKGYIQKDAATTKDGPTIRTAGKFFAFAVNLRPGYADEQSVSTKANGFVLGQVDVTEPVITNSETMGGMEAISVTSENPERAAMFLNLYNTDPYLNNLIVYGIEGKHYKKVSDNIIDTIPDSGYGPDNQWKFGNQFLNYLSSTEDPKKWDNYKVYNAKGKQIEGVGFIFDYVKGNVQNERASTDQVVAEFHPAMEVGSLDVNKALPEFISKLKAAGSDKLVEEMNKQYDEWKAANNK